TAGYDHDFPLVPGLSTALGAQVTFYGKPAFLIPVYGQHPVGVILFIRMRPTGYRASSLRTHMKTSRRDFLIGTSAVAGSSLVVPLSALAQQKAPKKATKKNEEAEEDVSTNEDLMREHGVLNRVLLIYDEALRRIQANEKFDPAVVANSA